MDVLDKSSTKEEKFSTSPIIVKEGDDNINEVNNALHAPETEIKNDYRIFVDTNNDQKTENSTSNSIELQMARKIDFLGHPLSSELLDRLNKDRDTERVDNNNIGFSSQYDNSKYLHSYPYRCYSIEEDRGGSGEYGSITSNYEQENSMITTRKRSNSKASSSGTRTVRNSSDISPASKIFRNLLILEDDLRQQARQQKRLRWQYTTFYSTLMGVAGFAVYELYFTTSNLVTPEHNYYYSSAIYSDNNNNHHHLNHYYVNSNNTLYRFMLQLMLMFVIITVFLFYISGQYRRTIILPRRFFNITNKGIKQFNIRLIKVHSSWDEKFTDLVRFITRNVALIQLWVLYQIFKCGDNVVVRFWENVRIRSQPRIGAVDVKLVLNPKAFSAEVREGWEIYRDEFWAREGARRRKTQSIK